MQIELSADVVNLLEVQSDVAKRVVDLYQTGTPLCKEAEEFLHYLLKLRAPEIKNETEAKQPLL